MSNRKNVKPAADPRKTVRCAIYTRKSTEEGLEQEFNSLDAQRESAEAYIAAQKHEGWVCLPEPYDDGGFSGGTLDRPALRRLLSDIESGKVDCVVVYKVDRLSRSLLDFSRIMQVFDAREVSFVSVTQQFNTTHSMGRLTLNILLSFAQFEREIISERTRDKIAAARRKGKWSGGKPLLGYDIISSPAGAKLAVNDDEARKVRGIYELYLRYEALIPTLKAVDEKGWVNKRWVTKKGPERGGSPLDKGTLHRLLTNKTYLGLITHGENTYPGEHAAIVEKDVFEKVQAVLARNSVSKGAVVKNRYGALLKGLLHCGCCRCAMIHSYTVKGEGKRYRYYVCLRAQKRGWDACATKSVPAGQIESFVVEQVKKVGKDPTLLAGTLRQVRSQQERELAETKAELKAVGREVVRLRKAGVTDMSVHEQVREAEQRETGLKETLRRLLREKVDEGEVARALSSFDPVWQQLSPKEQARVLALLVERVEYDGKEQTVSIRFRPTGLKALANEQYEEVAA